MGRWPAVYKKAVVKGWFAAAGGQTQVPVLLRDIGRIRLGNFVEHFQIVEHISYSTGTSRLCSLGEIFDLHRRHFISNAYIASAFCLHFCCHGPPQLLVYRIA